MRQLADSEKAPVGPALAAGYGSCGSAQLQHLWRCNPPSAVGHGVAIFDGNFNDDLHRICVGGRGGFGTPSLCVLVVCGLFGGRRPSDLLGLLVGL